MSRAFGRGLKCSFECRGPRGPVRGTRLDVWGLTSSQQCILQPPAKGGPHLSPKKVGHTYFGLKRWATPPKRWATPAKLFPFVLVILELSGGLSIPLDAQGGTLNVCETSWDIVKHLIPRNMLSIVCNVMLCTTQVA